MPSHRYGAPAQVIGTWRAGAFELLVSEPILAEYERALGYRQVQVRHGLSATEIAEIVDGFRQLGTLVAPSTSLMVIREDPDDNKFVECAVAGGAEYIASGDPHLRDLKEHEGIHVLTPAVFLTVLNRGQDESQG